MITLTHQNITYSSSTACPKFKLHQSTCLLSWSNFTFAFSNTRCAPLETIYPKDYDTARSEDRTQYNNHRENNVITGLRGKFFSSGISKTSICAISISNIIITSWYLDCGLLRSSLCCLPTG